MATLLRSRVTWSGSGVVGPGVSTFYNAGTATEANISTALNTFFTAIKSYVPQTVTWHVENGGDILEDSTGQLTGAWTSGGAYTVSATGIGNYAAGVGGRLNWKTSTIVGGRRVRGSFFFCPLLTPNYESDGTLSNSMVTAVNAAAAAYLGSAGLAPVIWHRPKTKTSADGSSAPITSADMPDAVSWLRSRRL